MPSYEAMLLLKKMPKTAMAEVLKRAANHIYSVQGLLFSIENLGTRRLPYEIPSHGKRHREASYFLLKFDAPPKAINILYDESKRDIDLVRAGFVKIRTPENLECTLEEELKPPAYREDVKKMIEEGRKKEIYVFQPKTGLDYNPFRM